MSTLYESMVKAHPKLERGMVWCHECGHFQVCHAGMYLAKGWPKCCGQTMSLDSPEERRVLANEVTMEKK